LPSPGPTISANENQLHQVLTNLVTNALEAVEENQGGIGLTVEVVSSVEIPATHRFPIGWQPQDSSYACVEMVDSGCGIREENIEKLFDPFFSSKFTGRGLGLSVVLGIVKAHGGAVTVESKERKGSTFRVFLPISAKEILSHPDKTFQSLTKEESGTVLLVEDEDIVRKMAEIMLTRLGFKVLLAKDGIEAVEIFRKHLEKISVVVSDLTMPRMNGWETLLKVRQIRPDIPIILASGYDESVAISGTHPNLPYQVFLHKPYQKATLKDALDRALEVKLHLTPPKDTKDNTCRLP
jgi:CheY-like chemotaxis protein